jgi:predicted anti-sigma-YlaC factor YlaD
MGNMSTTDGINCKELVELVTEYFEGALPPTERARFELHLQGCTGCRNYLEQMCQTINLTGKLTEESLSPAAREELLDIFRNWKREK